MECELNELMKGNPSEEFMKHMYQKYQKYCMLADTQQLSRLATMFAGTSYKALYEQICMIIKTRMQSTPLSEVPWESTPTWDELKAAETETNPEMKEDQNSDRAHHLEEAAVPNQEPELSEEEEDESGLWGSTWEDDPNAVS